VNGISYGASLVPVHMIVLSCTMESAGSIKNRADDWVKSSHSIDSRDENVGMTFNRGESPFQDPLIGPSLMDWPRLGMAHALGYAKDERLEMFKCVESMNPP
jgi:hypothetical protein